MSELFINVVNMSVSASLAVLAVLILRLALKKAPRWISVLLWGIVAIRLVCPFSVESAVSLMPSTEAISPQVLTYAPAINTGLPDADGTVGSSAVTVAPEKSINVLQLSVLILSKIWVAGVAAMLIYTALSYLSIKRRTRTAVLFYGNVFRSEKVASPFVLGIIKPRIYLPFDMNETDTEQVINHEKAHIRRKDHLWKPIGFLLLSLHWFNPLMWLGYLLLCRDIELACDEKVIKELDTEGKADYSQALLSSSVNKRVISACPLAFGETDVRHRIKSVLSYKKPAIWVVAAAVIASIAAAVCFLTDPATSTLEKIESLSLEDAKLQTLSVFVSDGESYAPVGAASRELLYELFDIKISKKEISRDRSEDRDRSHTLVLPSVKDTEPSPKSYIEGLYIHFDSEFTSVWVNNGVKPTFSYRIIDPQVAKRIYGDIAAMQYPGGSQVYDVTPESEIQAKLDNEEAVIRKLHYKASDGSWVCDGRTYKHRLEITGRMNNAAKNSTFIVLSNTDGITFDMAWKAAGFSSNLSDYFDPKDAVIVGHRSFLSSLSKSELGLAIEAAIAEKYSASKPDGLLHVQSYYMLANEIASGTPLAESFGHMERVTVYLIVYNMTYSVSGQSIEEHEGGFDATVITFDVDKDAGYSLHQYWSAQSSEKNESDIRIRFPKSCADDAVNAEKHAKALIEDNLRKATDKLKSN